MSDLTKHDTSIIEQVVIRGDLSKLSPAERARYYAAVCKSIGVNPLTRPFDYIVLNGRLTLYARRECADQLRRVHGISIEIVSRERLDDLYIVTARATDRSGRHDEATGVVSLAGLKGDALANALMKAETKAKRRVTLSLVGLGWLDETEIETIPEASRPDSDLLEQDIEQIEAGDGDGRALPDAGAKAHAPWTAVQEYVERFWAYCEKNNVSREEALSALGVKDISEFDGSASAAKEIIDEYIAWRAGANGEDGE